MKTKHIEKLMKQTFVALLALAALSSAGAQTRIAVDMTKTEAQIPALIYGAGAEDVNHEIYGGLYDQRIFGESFEESVPTIIENFRPYDSPWGLEDGVLKVYANGHGKIVYEGHPLQRGLGGGRRADGRRQRHCGTHHPYG